MAVGDDEKNWGQFKYITCDQIDKVGKLHPLVSRSLPWKNFQWLANCPDVDGDFPWYFYLTDNKKILSYIIALPDTLFVGGRTYRWAWTGGLVTDPAHRGRGLAQRLIQKMLQEFHRKDIGRGSVFSAAATVHIYRKLGLAQIGYVSRYLFLKTARPFLEYHVKSKLAVNIADWLFQKLIRLIMPLTLRIGNAPKCDVLVDRLGADDDGLEDGDFPKPNYKEKFHFNNNFSKIIWKLKETKHNAALYLVKSEATKEPLCYFIIRKKEVREPMLDKYENFTLMTLMDYGFFNDDVKVYEVLTNTVFNLFWKSEADVLEIISSSKILKGYAKRIGMMKVGKGMSITLSVPSKWNLGHHYSDLTKWHLTHFSGDAFAFL